MLIQNYLFNSVCKHLQIIYCEQPVSTSSSRMKGQVLVSVPFPCNSAFISSSRQTRLLSGNSRGIRSRTIHRDCVRRFSCICRCSVLICFPVFLQNFGSSEHFNLIQGKQSFCLFLLLLLPISMSELPISAQRDKQLRQSQCLGPSPESDEGFLPPLTLFDSHSYKVKGRLTSVLSCFRSLNLRFSVPDVLKIMCGDLTPISSWLWNPGRLNYEHNSIAFLLRLPEKHPLPSSLVQSLSKLLK